MLKLNTETEEMKAHKRARITPRGASKTRRENPQDPSRFQPSASSSISQSSDAQNPSLAQRCRPDLNIDGKKRPRASRPADIKRELRGESDLDEMEKRGTEEVGESAKGGGKDAKGKAEQLTNDVAFVLRKLYTGGGLDAQQQGWKNLPMNLFNTLTLQMGTLSKVCLALRCTTLHYLLLY